VCAKTDKKIRILTKKYFVPHSLLSDTKNLQTFLFSSTHYWQLSCDADGGAEEQGTDDDSGAPPSGLNALPPHPKLSDAKNLQEFLFP
jgi:hypothetical protein